METLYRKEMPEGSNATVAITLLILRQGHTSDGGQEHGQRGLLEASVTPQSCVRVFHFNDRQPL